MNAKDRLRVLQNIIARAGGIENVDLASELAKTMSPTYAMESQRQMAQMQQMDQAMPQESPQASGGTMSPDATQSSTPPENMATMP